MKLKLLFAVILVVAVGNSYAQSGFEFKDVVNIETTNVKNQGSSGTCWSYSANSFLETEMIRIGKKPVDLAEMFFVKKVYLDKGDRYVRMHGALKFGQGGALPDVFEMYKKYGAVPQEAFSGLNYGTEINRHGEMSTMLQAMLDAVIKNKNKSLTPVWKKAYEAVLDVYLGENEDRFTYNGKSYTPKSFAKDVVGLDGKDYVQFTSFTHQPFYENMIIMVPDNWNYGNAMNIPMDEMVEVIDHALKNGYSVAWASDVSEKFFSWSKGMAYVPSISYKKMQDEERETMFSYPIVEEKITKERRQMEYDNYQTTDDHAMHIVGISKDQDGKEWYLVKNSWDTRNAFEGYLYVSKEYFKLKTTAFMINKKSLSSNMKQKCKF